MNARIISLAAVCLGTLAFSSPGSAAEIELPAEGWASWEVAAVDGAPDMCCWNGMQPGAAARGACKLDQQRGNIGNVANATTDAVRVYVRVAGGNIDRLRALSASCPVEAATPIRDLGSQDADASARWLIANARRADVTKHESSRKNALEALGMHRGDVAYGELAAVARGGAVQDERKTAMFWLAKTRGLAGATLITELMFADKDSEVREHASFAITVSQSPRISQDLIRLGNTDEDGEVRAQAWFWLAQTGAAEAEKAIGAALRKDSDDRVREQAIFALSQLPDERATRALIATAEDRSLSREQRKRAVFWLAHSEKTGAQAYLEKVLAGNVSR
jgi:hypothetical protein